MTHSSTESAVRNIQVITTGNAEQHAEHRYGTSLPLLWWVLTSRSWIPIPINAYLVEHRDGLVLFDTGINPAIVSDPSYIDSAIGRFLLKRIFRFHVNPEDSLAGRLDAMGYSASDIRKAVISHLHFDHIGGIREIPQADLLISRKEWQQLELPNPEREWVLSEHIKLPGAKWCPVDFVTPEDPELVSFGGCFDVMGDGELMLLPTPGHTPGSMSLLIRSAGVPPTLLVGDLTYQLDLLMTGQVPGIGDKEELRSSFAKVRALKQSIPDLLVMPSHDPDAARTLAAALASQRAETISRTAPL